MKSVYLLRSTSYTDQTYVGITDDLERRIKDHNTGKSPHSSKFTPWRLVVAIKFEDDHKALEFEKYLKSGSGRAFANRHFW